MKTTSKIKMIPNMDKSPKIKVNSNMETTHKIGKNRKHFWNLKNQPQHEHPPQLLPEYCACVNVTTGKVLHSYTCTRYNIYNELEFMIRAQQGGIKYHLSSAWIPVDINMNY